jgi:hypothetical protein
MQINFLRAFKILIFLLEHNVVVVVIAVPNFSQRQKLFALSESKTFSALQPGCNILIGDGTA